MAEPAILRGTYLDIMLGDGTTPTEGFDPICGLNTRTFTGAVNTSDTYIRDCDDPEDIPHRRIMVQGKQWDLSGTGLLNRNQLADLQAVLGVPRNWRFVMGEPSGDLIYGGYYGGQGVLTNLTITGADAEYATVDLTIASDGDWPWTEV